MHNAPDKETRFQLWSIFLDVFTTFRPYWPEGKGYTVAMQDVHLGERLEWAGMSDGLTGSESNV